MRRKRKEYKGRMRLKKEENRVNKDERDKIIKNEKGEKKNERNQIRV